MIINSTYIEGPDQGDGPETIIDGETVRLPGRRYVTETHTDDQGQTYTFEWLGNQDANLVVTLRAENLNKQLQDKAAAMALVEGTMLPLSKLEFRNLFKGKKQAIDAFNAQFESHPALNEAQKSAIRSGLNDFAESNYIARPFRADVIALLNLYNMIGLLTTAEMQAILEVGNG